MNLKAYNEVVADGQRGRLVRTKSIWSDQGFNSESDRIYKPHQGYMAVAPAKSGHGSQPISWSGTHLNHTKLNSLILGRTPKKHTAVDAPEPFFPRFLIS